MPSGAASDKVTPLGILATSGQAPLNLANYVTGQGRPIMVITLEGITDADFSAFPNRQQRIGAIGGMIKDFLSAGVEDVVLCGHLKRPSLAEARPDLRGSMLVVKTLMAGDNKALQIIREEFAKDGLAIIDVADVMPSMTIEEGCLVGDAPDADAMLSIDLGADYLASGQGYDIGQSCVVQGTRFVAIEAAEGTDEMLKRAKGLIDPALSPAVFVKMLKPDQDKSLDPPGIGGRTVALAADAGISIIAIEANGVIIVDGDDGINTAKKAGLTLIGIPPSVILRQGD